MISVTDAETSKRNLSYTAQYTYNGLGQKVREAYPGTAYQYGYDGAGNLLKTEVNGTVKSSAAYTYDSLGRNLSRTVKDTEGAGIVTSAEYDNNGNVTKVTDGNGKSTISAYDELNRKTAETNALEQKTTYAYDANGNQAAEKDYLGNTTAKVYDGINRLIEVRDAYGNAVQQLTYNDADAQVSSCDALHNVIRYLYDSNLKLTGIVDGEGNASYTSYDVRGNISTKTDGSGNVTAYRYDGENRLIGVTDALGNSTAYTYDANGNLLAKTDGSGNTTAYQYNSADLLIEKTDPQDTGEAPGKEHYTYYADRLMATKTDRNGVITAYTYDVLENLTAEDAGGEVQSYTYDANGNPLTMTDATGTTARTYDGLNRNTSKTVPVIGKSTYEYDLAAEEAGGHSERTTDPKGNVTRSTYDRAGRMSAVQAGEGTTAYQYYRNGSRSRVIYPDGTAESYSYNRSSQVTYLANAKADGTAISSYRYTYDGAGNQLTKSEEKGTTAYAYDRLNRLSGVSAPDGKTFSYTYDGAGNRKTETVQYNQAGSMTVYSYNSQNRLTSTVSTGGAYTGYHYDGNGNLSSRTTGELKNPGAEALTIEDLPDFGLIVRRSSGSGTGTEHLTLYAYDHYNRLTGLKTEGTTAAYQYNAQGYRVKKTVNKETTNYLYNTDKVVLETDSSNRQTAFQAYGSALLYRATAGDADLPAQSYYYLYNAHGDVTALIDAAGTIAATYDYDAFGSLISKTGEADNTIQYAGYQKDEESGLYYLNARYYDSAIARFISEDSYTGKKNDPLSLNLYTYCSNNPVTYDDPSGHFLHILAGAGIGALVNVALTAAGDFLDDGEMNMGWEAYAGAAAEGAITGAAAAATGGASLVVTLAAGAAASGAGNAARQYITTGKVDAKKVVYAAATDAVAGGAGHLASVAVKKVTNSVIKVAASKADDAAKSAKNTISNGVKDSSNKIKTIAASSDIKGASKSEELHRPYVRKEVRKEVEANAPKTADGKFIDPNTRKPIEGKYDLGHKPGNEFKTEKAKAQSKELTQKEFNNRMNDPKKYQIEDQKSNRSHKYEQKSK